MYAERYESDYATNKGRKDSLKAKLRLGKPYVSTCTLLVTDSFFKRNVTELQKISRDNYDFLRMSAMGC